MPSLVRGDLVLGFGGLDEGRADLLDLNPCPSSMLSDAALHLVLCDRSA